MTFLPKNTYLVRNKKPEDAYLIVEIPTNFFELDQNKLYSISCEDVRNNENVSTQNLRYILDLIIQLQILKGFKQSSPYLTQGTSQREDFIDKVLEQVGTDAVNSQGKFVKRFTRFLYESEDLGEGLYVDQALLKENLNNITQRISDYLSRDVFSIRGDYIYFDLVRPVGWDVSAFGNNGSCYAPGREFGHNPKVFDDGEMAAMRFFSNEGKEYLLPFGRIWLQYAYERDHNKDKVVFFNPYGYGVNNIVQIFQSVFGLKVEQISLDNDYGGIYINNNRGWMCSPSSITEKYWDLALDVDWSYPDEDNYDSYEDYEDYHEEDRYVDSVEEFFCHYGDHSVYNRPIGYEMEDGSIIGICDSCLREIDSNSDFFKEKYVRGIVWEGPGSLHNYFREFQIKEENAIWLDKNYYSSSCVGHTIFKCDCCDQYTRRSGQRLIDGSYLCDSCLKDKGYHICYITQRLISSDETIFVSNSSKPIAKALEHIRWVTTEDGEIHYIKNCYMVMRNDGSYSYVYKNEYKDKDDENEFSDVKIVNYEKLYEDLKINNAAFISPAGVHEKNHYGSISPSRISYEPELNKDPEYVISNEEMLTLSESLRDWNALRNTQLNQFDLGNGYLRFPTLIFVSD